jgi:GWxTD domain-containing protein
MRKFFSSVIWAALFVIFVAPLRSPAQSPSHVTLSGRVVDQTTGLPLQNVNVFIPNTMLGAATDENGYFTIKHAPLGTYELIVSRIGYELKKEYLRLAEPADRQLDFRLAPAVLQAPEIVVSAAEQKQWKKNLKKFAELFLGTSRNAAQCKILNPEALDFEEEKGSRPFAAQASQSLQIENHALGYGIRLILENFSAKDEEVSYLVNARFEELSAKNPKEKQKWEENRLRAYYGSLRHFLAALAANRLQQEGFKVYRVLEPIRNDESPHRIEVNQPEVLFPGELPFERLLRFRAYLEVTYMKEKEEDDYINVRMQRDLSLLGMSSQTLALARDPRPQTSWIALRQQEMTMDIFGRFYDPLAVATYGYWAWERLAEKLPWEYSPPGVELPQQPIVIDDRDYEEEIKPETSGDWQKTLDTWLQAKAALEAKGESDPDIGIAFIELVTEKKATEYYEQACELYDWSFSQADLKKHKEEIETEIERIAPLLTENEYRAWRSDLEKGDPTLNAKIRNFWIEKDPTPTTRKNERLLEHWERIAFARKNFRESKNTIYGTDDRGLIYVKYGEPDRKKTVVLGNSLNGLIDLQEAYSFDLMAIRRGLGAYLTLPECELWAYYSLDPNESVVYIFGQKDGRETYGLRNGVEEFIPDEAFRRTNIGSRYTDGILPGSLIQIMYYNDLYAFDNSFARRYDELKSIWHQSSRFDQFPNHNVVRSVRKKFELADADNLVRKNAPADQSGVEKAIPRIQLISHPARFLDESNRPGLVFVAFAFPQGLGKGKPADRWREPREPDYQLRYTLIVRDGDVTEIQRISARPIAEGDNTAVLTIPHQETHAHYTLAVEAFATPSQKEAAGLDTLWGVGKAFFEKMTKLDPDPQQLEVSDLVIGVEPPPGLNVQLLPYPVVPSHQIRKPDALKVYLEIYHLHLDRDGTGHFNIDFRVIKLERKGEKIERAEMIASAFDFQATGQTAKEDFGISISNLKSGDYELEVEVEDKISGMKKQRRALFQIVEQDH